MHTFDAIVTVVVSGSNTGDNSNDIVRLDQPRPGVLRSVNEYISVPHEAAARVPIHQQQREKKRGHHLTLIGQLSPSPSSSSSSRSGPALGQIRTLSSLQKKGPVVTATASVGDVICRRCGKCRCASCKRRRRIPSRWLCGNRCLLSGYSNFRY